jgi:hypothetical protein
MKRVTVNLTDDQAAALKERAETVGIPQAEQIRQAIDLDLGLGKRHLPRAERFADLRETRQPVLFVPKASE